MRILIAEDNADIRTLLGVLLGRRGHSVEEAADGAEAFRKAAASPPDAVVSDVMMPEMDGFMLCKKMGADARLRHIPVILYTATAAERDEEELARKFGAARLVVKTEGVEALLEAVAAEVEKARAAGAPGPDGAEAAADDYERILLRKLQLKERELKAERDLAQNYLDVAGVMLCALDRNGKITLANRKAAQVLGHKEGELLGKDWFETCLPPELREPVRGVFGRLMAGDVEPVEYYENPVLTRGGELRVIAFHNAVLRDREGKITGILFSGEDVTERRDAEDEVRLKEMFLDNATDSIFVHDLEGRMIYVNGTACRSHGYSRAELLAIPLSRLDVPEYAARIGSRLEELKSKGEAIFETAHFRKDGSVLESEAHVRIIEMRGKKVILSVSRDITERKRSEEALRRAHKLDSVAQLAGGIAHDLNNLLGPVLAYADFLRKSLPAGDERLADLDEITLAADRASALVRQLLAFSRRQVLEPKDVGLDALVAEAADILRRVAGGGVKVNVSPGAAGGVVHVDRAQMEQVLINMAANARDAMPHGGTLSVGSSLEDLKGYHGLPDGRYGVISVRDTGAGMDRETLARVFEPFFTTKKAGEASGLGLSMAYGIIKQSGGDIRVESAPGSGSVFRIYLPLKGPAAAGARPPEAAASGRGVLLVEDDESMRKVARRILSGAGYEVAEAADGKAALAALSKASGSVSLLLTDMVMPELDGVELAKIVLEKYPHIRVLCMSGYVGKEEELSGMLGPRAGYVQKPFPPDLLLAKVRELLDGGRRA